MANLEKYRSAIFLKDNGEKAASVRAIIPGDFSVDVLKSIVGGAVALAQEGEPIRVHIVLLKGIIALTQADLKTERTSEELEGFKNMFASVILCSQGAYIIRKPKPPKNLSQEFINKNNNPKLDYLDGISGKQGKRAKPF